VGIGESQPPDLAKFGLSQEPIACIDYVVVHELLHLIEKKRLTQIFGFGELCKTTMGANGE
jgi:predicted metal-dependent hydrolase